MAVIPQSKFQGLPKASLLALHIDIKVDQAEPKREQHIGPDPDEPFNKRVRPGPKHRGLKELLNVLQ